MTACLALGMPPAGVVGSAALWAGLGAVAFWVALQRDFHGKPFFLLTLVGMLWWLAAATMEQWASGLECRLFWAKAAWPGIALLPTALAFFLFDHAFARSTAQRRWKRVAVAGGPAVLGLIAATNGLHGQLYGPQTRLDPDTGMVIYQHGPLFFAAAGYLYLYMGAGLVVLLAGALRTHPAHRSFFLVWLAITAVPVAANLAYILAGWTFLGMDPTPYSFLVALLLFTWLVFTSRLFDIRAIAKDILFFDTPNPILIVSSDARVEGANPEALRILGKGSTDIGTRLASWGEVGRLAARRIGQDAGRGPQSLEIGARSFDLQLTPIARPLNAADGGMGWIVVLRDITERRALEVRLEADRDFLARLMDTSMSGIIALDEGGRITFANAEAERVLGLGQPFMLGRRFDDPRWEVTTPEGGPLPSAALPVARVLATGETVRDARISVRRADGAKRVLSINAAPIVQPGLPVQVVCAVADITETLDHAEALRAASERAEAASRTKSQFLANMSHEIRTPMNGVLGMAEVLEQMLEDPAQRRLAATIRMSGEELLNILNDLLDMAKIEAGKLTLEAVPFRPAELAPRIEALHGIGARARGLELRVECGPGCERVRLGDPHRILQILHNLLGNAIKFTEAGHVALCMGCDAAGSLRLAVADTGIGMNEAQRERIFDEFEQADGSVARRFGGTGLGLAITRGLVHQMGGSLALETSPGAGTTVTVTLPLPLADHAVPAGDAAAGAGANGRAGMTAGALSGLRLLAADDNATNRLVLKAMLRDTGAQLELVADGRHAVDAWEPGRFDAVLLDIAMPGLDGVAALRAIREKARAAGAPPPPAVAITANVMTHHLVEYRNAGFDAHAGKPFHAHLLVAAVQQACAARGIPAPAPPPAPDPLGEALG